MRSLYASWGLKAEDKFTIEDRVSDSKTKTVIPAETSSLKKYKSMKGLSIRVQKLRIKLKVFFSKANRSLLKHQSAWIILYQRIDLAICSTEGLPVTVKFKSYKQGSGFFQRYTEKLTERWMVGLLESSISLPE